MEAETTATKFGWQPVREIPAEFSALVHQAESAVLNDELASSDAGACEAAELWEQICSHQRFNSAPLTFQLDALNRSGVTLMFCGDSSTTLANLMFRRARQRFQQALEIAPTDWPNRPDYLHNLGTLHKAAFDSLSDRSELETAKRLFEEAIAASGSQYRNLALFKYSLAMVLQHSYEIRGVLADLEYAIDCLKSAIESTRERSPRFPMMLNQLGSLHRLRYFRLNEEEDLEYAIELQKQSLTYPTRNENRAARLTNLGNSLLNRAELRSSEQDLDRALDAHREAIALTSDDAPRLPSRFNNLGNSLSKKFSRTNRLSDLDETIGAYQRAVDLTPPSAWEITSRRYNLANSYRQRYFFSRNADDRELARQNYRLACATGLEFSLEWTLGAALNWGDWALAEGESKEAAEAYNFGMTAIDRLYRAQLLEGSKAIWLDQARDLHTRAAFALAKSGDNHGAIVCIEQGRARALHESLHRDRADLEHLRNIEPEKYASFRDAAENLRSIERASVGEISTVAEDEDKSSQVEVLSSVRMAREKLDTAVIGIRQVRGYEHFLDITNWQQIEQDMPDDVPLLYLITTFVGSLEILVEKRASTKYVDCSAIWIEDFTESDLDAQVDAWFMAYSNRRDSFDDWLQAIKQQVESLFASVVEPVIKLLHSKNLEHAVWIPTGKWAYLPLHAARAKTQDEAQYALEKAAFSYAPSAQAYRFARKFAGSAKERRLLAVADPQPVSMAQSLWYAIEEVDAVSSHFECYDSLPRNWALESNVLKKLPGATVAHFACHGFVDWKEPGKSGLVMAGNDVLTVDEISDLRLTEGRLAVLSACGTGIVGTHLPSEIVSLPSAFLRAGFAGVVGSLWAVEGVSTSLLMAEFYRQWLVNKKEPAYALRDAQIWLRDASADELGLETIYASIFSASGRKEKRAARMSLYYRSHSDDVPFAHPYYWAPFILVGL